MRTNGYHYSIKALCLPCHPTLAAAVVEMVVCERVGGDVSSSAVNHTQVTR